MDDQRQECSSFARDNASGEAEDYAVPCGIPPLSMEFQESERLTRGLAGPKSKACSRDMMPASIDHWARGLDEPSIVSVRSTIERLTTCWVDILAN